MSPKFSLQNVLDLRHGKVEVFDRAEDSDVGIHVSVADGAHFVDNDLTVNPSDRRHGLCIHFTCNVNGNTAGCAK